MHTHTHSVFVRRTQIHTGTIKNTVSHVHTCKKCDVIIDVVPGYDPLTVPAFPKKKKKGLFKVTQSIEIIFNLSLHSKYHTMQLYRKTDTISD